MHFYLKVVWFDFSQLRGSLSAVHNMINFCYMSIHIVNFSTRNRDTLWVLGWNTCYFFDWQSKNWNSYLNELYSNFLSLSIPITYTLMQIRSRFAINPLIFQLINMQKCRGMNKSVFSVQKRFPKKWKK